MAIVFSERFIDHIQTANHPESPRRLIAIIDSLKKHDLWKNIIEPGMATAEEIESVHSKEYLQFLSTAGDCMLTLDTVLHAETYEIAKLAAGGAIIAGTQAWDKCKPTIALLRPPGHHSGPDYGMGFCYLNNIAIAAEYLLKKAGKIAIVDIDVHHGNGTQEIFHKRSDVLYISTHQKHIFPGSGFKEDVGIGDGEGYTVNIPMNSGAGDESFRFAHERIVLPILEEFAPEILLVSIGSDAHYRDPLASLSLSSEGYGWEIENLINFARSRCEGRIAFYLEGGYDLEALSEVLFYTVGLFEGKRIPMKYTDIRDKNCLEKDSLEKIINIQKDYWKL